MSVLLQTAASFCLFAALYWPLERLFPARAGQRVFRREWVTDVTFFLGQRLLWNAVALSLLIGVALAIPEIEMSAVHAWVAAQSPVLQAVGAMVMGDVLIYWFHRACHRFDVLWRFHAVHHSAEHLDWVAGYREHPLDGIATRLILNAPPFLLGVSSELLIALAAARGLWALFIHSNVRLPLGPLRLLLGAPDLHHWHHARVERTRHNFANLAPWLDVLFGTYHRPKGAEEYALGLTIPWPRGYLAQLLRPLAPRATRSEPTERASAGPSSQGASP